MKLLWRWLTRLVGWLFHRAPGRQAGVWSDGACSAKQGRLGIAPWVRPRRRFRLYAPGGHNPQAPAPLVVWIHGCRQTADEFARGARIADAADRYGCVVLQPEQTRLANLYRCWNWFDPRTARGEGEAAIVVAQIAEVKRRYLIDGDRVFVVGVSSGGGLAAILALRWHTLFTGAAIVAGVAVGAAKSLLRARQAVERGPQEDVLTIAKMVRASSTAPPFLKTLILQGMDDKRVKPFHAMMLARQFLLLNGDSSSDGVRDPDKTSIEKVDTRSVTSRDFLVDKRLAVRLVLIDGLGHAWSGGDTRIRYMDARGPDATELVMRFLFDS